MHFVLSRGIWGESSCVCEQLERLTLGVENRKPQYAPLAIRLYHGLLLFPRVKSPTHHREDLADSAKLRFTYVMTDVP